MHKKGYMHRDIKLENIVFETKKKNSDIVILDLGLA